jgi:hypothetical protein
MVVCKAILNTNCGGNMSEILFLVEQAPEGGYTARSMSESIFTEADTLPELRKMVQDAVHCHFDESDMPKIIRLHIVQEEMLAA